MMQKPLELGKPEPQNPPVIKEQVDVKTKTDPAEEILFRPQQQRDIVWRWQMRRRVRRRVA
ncbi:MAG: hypothetical protein EI684_07785 [Candidatus Viridilinea halotolerans]|uniref:Uncharacterized protein n=1 Tax=Candidatus Viridilinea halotolerans TaxID=2491704 RepID=A0A426U2Z0_9CHLR|nr:MAG: hypothetical protein EI684_07785 [Candidatus Viridilinea halotolerans]